MWLTGCARTLQENNDGPTLRSKGEKSEGNKRQTKRRERCRFIDVLEEKSKREVGTKAALQALGRHVPALAACGSLRKQFSAQSLPGDH